MMRLFDIIEREKWRKMQDSFSKALGICISTVDLECRPFPGINVPSSFCLDIISKTPKYRRLMHEECVSRLINKIKKDRTHNYSVGPFGEYIYGIPIELKEGETLAYVLVGPVLIQKPKTITEYKKIAKENRIPFDFLLDKVSDLKRFSFSTIESTIQLFHEVMHYIVQLNYNTRRLEEKFTGISSGLDVLIKEIYSSAFFEELLSTLLDVSLQTTKGNTGSIMILDEDKDELSVRFSRGLKDDIVKDARVRVGKGISGMVARDKKPLLLDGSIKNPKIKNRLKRPSIKSSMVYPLEARDKLFGVLNLNYTDKKRKFNTESLDLVSSLTRLTRIALDQFSKTTPLT